VVGGRHTDVDDAERPPCWRRQTRFWIELRKRMTARGWLSGWSHDAAAATIRVPGLIVVDYAEAVEPNALRVVLSQLRRHASHGVPVCVLILTRTRSDSANDVLDPLREQATAARQRLSIPASSDVADADLKCPRVIARPHLERKWYAICNNSRSGDVPRAHSLLFDQDTS
jgi:hypothetical protein